MTTKQLLVLGFWAIAVILFALVGFTIEDGRPDFDFFGLGLASYVIGQTINVFWAG